jgi:hypothetical protein
MLLLVAKGWLTCIGLVFPFSKTTTIMMVVFVKIRGRRRGFLLRI